MFTVYSKKNCTFCKQTQILLDIRGIPYTWKTIVDRDDEVYKELTERLGYAPKTVPQIFVATKHIGGFEELKDFLECWDATDL